MIHMTRKAKSVVTASAMIFFGGIALSLRIGATSEYDPQIFMLLRLPRTISAIAVGGGLDLQAHEERAGVVARELRRLGDVAPGLDDRAAHRVHDAGRVRADQRQGPVGRARGHVGRVAHPTRVVPRPVCFGLVAGL